MSPDAYRNSEARYIQEKYSQSAADALLLVSDAVPTGKVWTILAGVYYPSVSELRTVWLGINRPSGNSFATMTPVTITLSNLIPLPFVTEGMEQKLFPGERLAAYRTVATAGSTMTINFRFVETDLDFYEYVEPLRRVVRTVQKHGSVFRAGGGISEGGESPGPSFEEGGKGGGPEPV